MLINITKEHLKVYFTNQKKDLKNVLIDFLRFLIKLKESLIFSTNNYLYLEFKGRVGVTELSNLPFPYKFSSISGVKAVFNLN